MNKRDNEYRISRILKYKQYLTSDEIKFIQRIQNTWPINQNLHKRLKFIECKLNHELLLNRAKQQNAIIKKT